MLVASKQWRLSPSGAVQSRTIQGNTQYWPVSSGILALVLYLEPTFF